MDWIIKLLDNFKIPLKIILPSSWLFPAAMILLPDFWLIEMGLFDWKNDNRFIIGLILAITTCFMAVYAIVYTKTMVKSTFYKLFRHRLVLKKFLKLGDIEQNIILSLYHSPTRTLDLDYGQPIVQGLLGQRYIYCGSQQLINLSADSTRLFVRFTLQPFIYQMLDHYEESLAKKIRRIERKIEKNGGESNSLNLLNELQEHKALYSRYFGHKWVELMRGLG